MANMELSDRRGPLRAAEMLDRSVAVLGRRSPKHDAAVDAILRELRDHVGESMLVAESSASLDDAFPPAMTYKRVGNAPFDAIMSRQRTLVGRHRRDLNPEAVQRLYERLGPAARLDVALEDVTRREEQARSRAGDNPGKLESVRVEHDKLRHRVRLKAVRAADSDEFDGVTDPDLVRALELRGHNPHLLLVFDHGGRLPPRQVLEQLVYSSRNLCITAVFVCTDAMALPPNASIHVWHNVIADRFTARVFFERRLARFGEPVAIADDTIRNACDVPGGGILVTRRAEHARVICPINIPPIDHRPLRTGSELAWHISTGQAEPGLNK